MARPRLRQRREDLGLTQEQLAERIGSDTKTVARYEQGKSTPLPGMRPPLAKALEWTLPQLAVALNHNGESEPRLDGHAVPQWLTLHASLEQGASHLWAFHPFTVHALLQTPDYAAALERVDATPKTDDGIARRVEMRRARQRVLTREPEPLHLSVILDESVLHRVTGDPDVMAAQLDHLADASDYPNVDLHILPLEAGQHSAAFGAFTMIASPGATAPQIVCVEDRTGIRYLEGPHAVDAHVAVFEHLCTYSLSPAESVDAIRTISKEKYQDE